MSTPTATRQGRADPRRTVLAGLLFALALAAHGRAQFQPTSPFEMVGFIQAATLDDPADVFSGGTLTLNNEVVVVPRYTIVQMPATAFTWAEIFKFAPAPYGPTQTGLALADTPKPFATFEVTVQGNRVQDAYVAGLLFVSQKPVQTHQGFISFVDYKAGELRVNGTPGSAATGARVRLNDPVGRFGRRMSPDARFTINESNPTVRAETGFPMCLPRTDPAMAIDPACPQKNRPKDPATGLFQRIFTMPPPSGATGAPDARLMAPFEIGDYITYSGMLTPDGYLAAWIVKANLGIFTTPGSQPAYVAIDVIVMGTGNTSFAGPAQEGARRTRVEGFTTDVTQGIDVFAVDVDPCTGTPTDRYWGSQTADPGPPNGVVPGRWRFRPGAPLFNLKGFPFLPPTREVHAVSQRGVGTALANGLVPGQYQLANVEFLLPENLTVGAPPIPANFDEMRFLAQGSGPWFGGGGFTTTRPQGIVGQISPFPLVVPPLATACADAAVRPPVAVAGPVQTVDSRAAVTLNGSASSDPNAPPRAMTFSWRQTSGPAVTLTGANAATASFTAPFVPPDVAAQTLEFVLTADNGVFASTAVTRVTVRPIVITGPVVDTMVFSEGPGARTTPPLTTMMPGERLVAFAASDGPPQVNTQTLTISGGGLTWTRVRRAATRYGDAEIWTATALGVLSGVTVTSTQTAASNPGFHQSLTVIAFAGVSGIGASGAGGALTGAPTVSLVVQAAGSLVYGVGNDWDHAVARTIPAGQTKVHEFVDAATGDTFWVETVNAPTAAAGAAVTLKATAPTSDQWNLAVVELKR